MSGDSAAVSRILRLGLVCQTRLDGCRYNRNGTMVGAGFYNGGPRTLDCIGNGI